MTVKSRYLQNAWQPDRPARARKYTTELRKKITASQALAALGSGASWEAVERRNLDALLTFYGISWRSPTRWRELSLELARAHVPCFQISMKGRGRPKLATSGPREKRGPGAPRKWDEVSCLLILLCYQKGKESLEARNAGGRITNVTVLSEGIQKVFPGKSAKAVRERADRYAKRLSQCRKLLPKFPEY